MRAASHSKTSYRLVSFKLCPYVQRSLIVLEERGTPYEVEYIDLRSKPDWFTAISPLGKVPVLLVGHVALFESAAINEYIDETAPGERLLPDDPLLRAQHRGWVEVSSELFHHVHALTHAPSQEEARAAVRRMAPLLDRLNHRVRTPWFAGERFSLVDAATAPALQRLGWCEELAPSLNLFDPVPVVRAWRDALLDRDSVRRSTVPGIHDLFLEMLRGRRGLRRDQEPSWLGRLSLSY